MFEPSYFIFLHPLELPVLDVSRGKSCVSLAVLVTSKVPQPHVIAGVGKYKSCGGGKRTWEP